MLERKSVTAVDLKTLPRRKSPTFLNTYANYIELYGSLHDIGIVFNEIIDGGAVEEKCRVAISPVQAKLLIRALTEQMRKWESAFAFTVPDISGSPEAEIIELPPRHPSSDSANESEPQP